MRFSGLLTTFLLLIGMCVIAVQLTPSTAIPYPMSIESENSFTPTSDPIIIASEMDFLGFISSGNGSESNPYVIEDLIILTEYNGIEVQNTQSWFEIRNCTISSDTRGLNGIYCHNVSHAAVVNCTITKMLDGVYFSHSHSCQVLSSSFSNTEAHGIRVEICSEITISENLAFDNDDDGIFFTGRNRGSVISFNTVWDNGFHGIFLEALRDVSIFGNVINSCEFGLLFERSENNTVNNNEFNHHALGGLLYESSGNNTASGNIFRDCGILIHGYPLDDWILTLPNNTINGRSIKYFYNTNSTVIDSKDYGQLILANCHDVVVKEAELSTVDTGIRLGFCTNITVTNCKIYNNSRDAIILQYSSNCKVIDNEFLSNDDIGVNLFTSSECVVSNNVISRNQDGVMLFRSLNCTIHDNVISYNTRYGIRLTFESNYNEIYQNQIGWNELANGYDNSVENSWDDGSTGNAWSDYLGNGTYPISGDSESIDMYPSLLIINTTIPTTTDTFPTFTTTLDNPDLTLFYLGVGFATILLIVFVLLARKQYG